MSRGNGRIFLRGQTYWIAYFLRGVEYRESTKTADEKEAQKFLRVRIKEVHADQIGARPFVSPRANSMTIAEAIQALRADFGLRNKLSRANLSHLKRAENDFGQYRAADLTPEQIDRYVSGRLTAGHAHASINRSLQVLKQAYGLAIKRGHLNRMPHIRRLGEAGNARTGFLEPSEFSKLLAVLPADLQDFCSWGYATAMRKGEIALLRWDMVHGDELRIPGNITKNRIGRTIPLVGELASIIARRKVARRIEENGVTKISELVFHRKGEPVRGFFKAWKSATKRAGLEGRIFHDFRRSAVRNMTQAGIAQAVAMKISGHKTASMFQRYNIVDTDDLRSALERTEKYREATTGNVVEIAQRK